MKQKTIFWFSLGLKNEIRAVCAEEFLVCGEGDEHGNTWMEKVMYMNKFLYDKECSNYY